MKYNFSILQFKRVKYRINLDSCNTSQIIIKAYWIDLYQWLEKLKKLWFEFHNNQNNIIMIYKKKFDEYIKIELYPIVFLIHCGKGTKKSIHCKFIFGKYWNESIIFSKDKSHMKIQFNIHGSLLIFNDKFLLLVILIKFVVCFE